ncbi:non-specific serine/threonine protein kinase [Citrus sinensis]|nr:non-specific serine/threonine protein kinase [Citrus sinensis]
MKLDVDVLRYLSKDDFRVLTAVEMGTRNVLYSLFNTFFSLLTFSMKLYLSELVLRIASLNLFISNNFIIICTCMYGHVGTYKVLKNLLRYKLLHHDSSKYDGFRLTYLGYDFLAFKTLVNHGVFTAVGCQLGISFRLHRLGRTSFRAVKSKCDYLRHRNSYNWLYLCRLALCDYVDCNKHCVIMYLVHSYPLVQVNQLQNPETVLKPSLIDDDERVTMIDFPQMVFVSHQNDQMYFDRGVECIFKFFRKRFHLNFQETTDGNDGSDIDTEECSRLSFASISKTAGFLFIEGGIKNESGPNDEGSDDRNESEVNGTNVSGLDSLHLAEQI